MSTNSPLLTLPQQSTTTTGDASVAEIRARICDGFILALAAVALPALAASLLRITVIGWLTVMGVHIALVTCHFVVTVLRHRIPYAWRSAYVIALFLVLAIFGWINFGIIGAGGTYLIGATVIAVLLFDVRVGSLVFCGGIGLFLVVVALRSFGMFPYTFDVGAYVISAPAWINVLTSLVLIGVATVVSVSVFNRHLITAVRRANDERNRLDAVFATAPDGILMVAENGEILSANRQADLIFGYQPGELRGLSINHLVQPHPGTATRHAGIAAAPSGTSPTITSGDDLVGLRKDGTAVPVAVSVGSLKSSDEKLTVAIVHDITERKHAEGRIQQLARTEAIGRLTGGVAHDFNNLLAVIGGNFELIETMAADRPDLARFTQAGLHAVDQGAALTGSLLSYARRQSLTPAILDVGHLVEELAPLIKGSAPGNVTVEILAATERCRCEVDAGRLQDALLGLVANAIDAMPTGGRLTVELSDVTFTQANEALRPDVPAGRYIRLLVRDTGHGMTAEVKARAFEPFFTTKNVGQGNGLGLSMAHGFARQSNGYIAIDSHPGQGTTVSIFLPPVDVVATADEQSLVKATG